MTTSTDNNTPVQKDKKNKVKGPIRTEAVVPVAVIVVLSFLYFHFLFDSNVRKGIEWTSTYIHGAEVNVGAFKSNFIGGSFSLTDLQVTDKEQPTRNLIQIGEIKFGFLWDALLRAKFVVNDAAITKIQIFSPRKKPGYVKPPEPPTKSSGPSEIEKIEKNVLTQAQKDNAQNALGNLASLLGGTDEKDVLKNIQGSLQAEKRINDLQAQLKEKEKAWKERIEKLPRKEEFEDLVKRSKALKFDTKDPKQFADDLKEASKIVKEADAKVDFLKASSKELKTDLDKYKTEFNQLDDIIKKDIQDLESRLKIPNLDLGDFSKSIFMKLVAQKLGSLQKYMEVARKYMPPPKDPNAPKEKELIPPQRGKGKNYRFPITTGYPLFWLKRAAISSEPTDAGFSGKISGELTNVSSDPAFIKKPAILDVKGDFPHSSVYGAALKLTIDHISEPKETLEISVSSFPFNGQSFVNDSNLTLGVKSSTGSSQFNAQLQNQTLNVSMNNQFQKIDYDLQAKSKGVQEAVQTILAGIPVITLNANATGSWDQLNLHINSNLGSELSAGLKKFVQAKVDAMKKQVKEFVDNKIKGQREKLDGEFNKIKGQTDKVLADKQSEVDKAKNEVKSGTDKKASSSNKLKDDLKEKGKKLLKGFKF